MWISSFLVMFHYPDKKTFRWICVFAAAGHVMMLVVGMMETAAMKDVTRVALTWLGYDSIVSPGVIKVIYATLFFGNCLGVVGMCFFWSWCRHLLLALLVMQLLVTPFVGLAVVTSLMNTLSTLVGLATSFVLVLSLFRPCSGYFEEE